MNEESPLGLVGFLVVSQAWLRCGEVGSGEWRLSSEECTREHTKCEVKHCPSKREHRTWGVGQSGSPENLGWEMVALDYHSFFRSTNSP